MTLSEAFNEKASHFYKCADDLTTRIDQLTATRAMLLGFADDYSEAAINAHTKEMAAQNGSGEQP